MSDEDHQPVIEKPVKTPKLQQDRLKRRPSDAQEEPSEPFTVRGIKPDTKPE